MHVLAQQQQQHVVLTTPFVNFIDYHHRHLLQHSMASPCTSGICWHTSATTSQRDSTIQVWMRMQYRAAQVGLLQLPQQNSSRTEHQPCVSGALGFESDGIPDAATHCLTSLGSDALCYTDGSDTSRLSAQDIACVLQLIEEELGNLGHRREAQSAAAVAWLALAGFLTSFHSTYTQRTRK